MYGQGSPVLIPCVLFAYVFVWVGAIMGAVAAARALYALLEVCLHFTCAWYAKIGVAAV